MTFAEYLIKELKKFCDAKIFVDHIKEHIKEVEGAEVICKICNKTMKEIVDEEMRNRKG